MRQVALIAIVFALSCSSTHKDYEQRFDDSIDSIEKAIRENVVDESRAVRLLVIQEKIRATTKSLLAEFDSMTPRWLAANANYDADPGTFTAMQNSMAASRRRHAGQLIRHAMEARGVATAEDWVAMAKDRR